MQRDFAALGERNFDLAIIGGGATGAAIAMDAALRGLSVALIDKGDFAAATSAGSTKLMHGGLRYLANGDILQVREGLRERRHWSRMAKHLVHPLPFIIPTYETNAPSKRVLKMGLYLYDWLAFDRNRGVDPMQKMPGHRHMTAAQLLGLSPHTSRQGQQGRLTGGLMYHDGQMLSPERLVLAMLRTAVQAGAVVVNHAEATDFIKQGNTLVGLEVADKLSRAETRLNASVSINATGPWADLLMAHAAGDGLAGKKLVRSKGVHLITRSLTRGAALAIPLEDEHLFVTPYMGMSILATTDTKFDQSPDALAIEESDIDSLLDKVNRAMPDLALHRDDIVFAYIGLRPLVADIDDAPDATYGLSRGSEVYDHESETTGAGGLRGMISALGGKWTTSRRLAEQIVDLAFVKLGRAPAHQRSCDTLLACTPRDDLGQFMDRMRAAYPQIETETIDMLSRLYGRLLPDMLAADTHGLDGLKDPVLAARVAFALSDEMAMHLSDIVVRRLVEGQLGMLSPHQIELIGDYMAAQLGWSAAETKKQKQAVARLLSLPATKSATKRTPKRTPAKPEASQKANKKPIGKTKS